MLQKMSAKKQKETLESTNRNGATALIIAAHRGHETVVQELVDKKAALNTANAAGRTALASAARCGKESAAKVLRARMNNIE